jgi:hypothetical protein
MLAFLQILSISFPKYHFRDRVYLKFAALTLVPFEKNLIDLCLLTKDQVYLVLINFCSTAIKYLNKKVDYLNDYNSLINQKVYPSLDSEHQVYLTKKTEKFEYAHNLKECNSYSSANSLKLNIYLAALSLIYLFKFLF